MGGKVLGLKKGVSQSVSEPRTFSKIHEVNLEMTNMMIIATYAASERAVSQTCPVRH